jgi:thiamine biosynthesis lipoprotein
MTATLTWTERRWYAMGSDAHCLVAAPDAQVVGLAIEELERLERCWSRFRPDSELVALNQHPADEVRVSPTLAAAVHRAVVAWELTDGWFDPTVIDSLEAAGYRRSFVAEAPPRGSLARCRPSPGAGCIRVDLDGNVVRRPPGLRIDLGGLGKGLAADMVGAALVGAGATSACVALGGDVRVTGAPPEGGWQIPVLRCGATDQPWFDALLDEGAIVTSTTAIRRWRTLDGHEAHHLIDPHTGAPSNGTVTTVVVAAAEAWWAEALAKAALLAGTEVGGRLLARHGASGWFEESAQAG